jgi:hypothetical protein
VRCLNLVQHIVVQSMFFMWACAVHRRLRGSEAESGRKLNNRSFVICVLSSEGG